VLSNMEGILAHEAMTQGQSSSSMAGPSRVVTVHDTTPSLPRQTYPLDPLHTPPVHAYSQPGSQPNGSSYRSMNSILSDPKGKSRATDVMPNQDTSDSTGKRAPKKRRISENDPSTPQLNGFVRKPRQSNPGTLASRITPSSDATKYNDRVLVNMKKPPWPGIADPPVWAQTRQTVSTIAEYLRNPISSEGACVEVGIGSLARGIILEGGQFGRPLYWSSAYEKPLIEANM
jgi:hypothetical protein